MVITQVWVKKQDGINEIIQRIQTQEPVSRNENQQLYSMTRQLVRACLRKKIYQISRQQQQLDELSHDLTTKIILEKISLYNTSKYSNYNAWVSKIAYNFAIDLYRQSKGYITVSIDEPQQSEGEENWLYDLPEQTNFEKSVIQVKDMLSVLRSSLQTLDLISKGIIIDYEFTGLTVKEISRKYRISETAIYVRLYRARRQLKKILIHRFHFKGSDFY